jgi:hypothetical protein
VRRKAQSWQSVGSAFIGQAGNETHLWLRLLLNFVCSRVKTGCLTKDYLSVHASQQNVSQKTICLFMRHNRMSHRKVICLFMRHSKVSHKCYLSVHASQQGVSQILFVCSCVTAEYFTKWLFVCSCVTTGYLTKNVICLLMKTSVSWDVIPYTLVETYRRFVRTFFSGCPTYRHSPEILT